MADPFTILLFVAIGEGSDATTRAMERATRDALGPGSHVEVRETANQLTDDDARISEELAHADAVVDLTWGDTVHRNATLRVHIARTGRWISRSIGFMASDASRERGRTIGFAVVSMLPEAGGDEPAAPNAPTPPASPNPSTQPNPPSSPEGHDRFVPPPRETALPAVAPAMSPLGLDLFALGSKGIGGDGDGGGGAVAVSWFARAPLSLRLGCGLRAGSIEGVPSTTLTVTVSPGVAWHPVRSTLAHPLGVSLRAEYVLLYQSMQNLMTGATPKSRSGWLSGVGAVVEPAWLLAPDVEGVVGLGLEEVFVPATVTVNGVPKATVPPLRALVEIGVRVRF